MTSPTYMIAHGNTAVQAARIIAEVAAGRDADRPTVATQQCGEPDNDGVMLLEIAALVADWRAGYIKSVYVMSRLSQMFPPH